MPPPTGVADVGKRQARPGAGQELPERQRVVVVGGAVVGDDEVSGHAADPP